MGRYQGNAAAVRGLVRETAVHRDVYVDQEIFDLEMEHLFANTWIYVGHDSLVPNASQAVGVTLQSSNPCTVVIAPTATMLTPTDNCCSCNSCTGNQIPAGQVPHCQA